jgi:nicotinate-nucleotide adenylyltransferase
VKPSPHLLNSENYRGLRIGLLGGSFNPAHDGHVFISLFALKALKLDYVWWLASPQNPLKSGKGMASLKERMKGAEALTAPHRRILVTGIECQLGTRFTADTLHKLRLRYPRTHFVWLMGADNMLQMPRWQRWQEIFQKTDVAVFRRPPYFAGVTHGIAAIRFKHGRLAAEKAKLLGRTNKKQWVLFNNRLHDASATQIRESMKRV